MKLVLVLASAAAALALSPALAQPAPAPAGPDPSTYVQPSFDSGAWSHAYSSERGPRTAQCFSGQEIKAVSRSGARNLLVRTGRGDLYDLRMSDGCAAADAASKITARAGRYPEVCAADTAVLFLKTPAGPKRCHVADVRRLSSGDVAALSSARRR